MVGGCYIDRVVKGECWKNGTGTVQTPSGAGGRAREGLARPTAPAAAAKLC